MQIQQTWNQKLTLRGRGRVQTFLSHIHLFKSLSFTVIPCFWIPPGDPPSLLMNKTITQANVSCQPVGCAIIHWSVCQCVCRPVCVLNLIENLPILKNPEHLSFLSSFLLFKMCFDSRVGSDTKSSYWADTTAFAIELWYWFTSALFTPLRAQLEWLCFHSDCDVHKTL